MPICHPPFNTCLYESPYLLLFFLRIESPYLFIFEKEFIYLYHQTAFISTINFSSPEIIFGEIICFSVFLYFFIRKL